MTTKAEVRAAMKPAREIRHFAVQPEIRKKDGSDTLTLEGYASTTNDPYEMHDLFGPYQEVVRVGAFQKSLKEQDDVRLLLNHDGLPLARTKSGTLTLSEILETKDDPQGKEQTGLWVQADLEPRMNLVHDVNLAMSRGDLSEMSFAFQVTLQAWSPDFEQRDIIEVRMFDVSVVTYPANPNTSAAIRQASVMNAIRAIREGQRVARADAEVLLPMLEAWDPSAEVQPRTKAEGGIPLSLARRLLEEL